MPLLGGSTSVKPNGRINSLTPNGGNARLLPNGCNGGLLNVRSVRDVAAAVRGRRQDAGLSQAQLAARAGVSRKWIYEFEGGKPTAELGFVLRVLDAVGLQLEVQPGIRRPSRDSGAVDLDTVFEQLRDGEGEPGKSG
jgi:HTH-type transcriptional regulator / antitoxin HipB